MSYAKITATVLLLAACRSVSTTTAALTGTEPGGSSDVQCDPRMGFKGTCSVTEVSGHNRTTTEDARAADLGALKELIIALPGQSNGGSSTVEFVKGNQKVDDWKIGGAMDLYNRSGCISQLAGGAVGEGQVPRLTLRVIFNQHDNGRTGFAEASDLRTGTPVDAMIGLKCAWTR